jgi:aconitate hydratase
VLEAGGERYTYANLRDVLPELNGIPRSLRILFENVARRSPEALPAIRAWAREPAGFHEIPFYPARILMHDTTCGPALADLAALRDAVAAAGGDPRRANPVIPVDLVIDHSVAVDHHARKNAIELNLAADFRRNAERYAFVKWAMQALSNFRVVPPGNGILHQLNLEFLARVVQVSVQADGSKLAFPDTLLGTDSHTPMVNALGVLGWGVGGIEGQAAMLGQAVAVRIPPVVGVELQGTLPSGVGATDLVLAATQALRAHGVVGKFVEFFGAGVRSLSLADRATLSNMAPEYGATCAFFPIDEATLAYLHLTGRNEAHIELIERYARAQGLWQDNDALQFSEVTRIDLAAIEPTVAGPSQPHERRSLSGVPASFAVQSNKEDGAVVLAAITSCTNTSNPALLVGAGLLARKARALGLAPKPWVKTSFSPGSAAVSAYLGESGLLEDLEALGFGVVGYGCMTCIGNSGELDAQVIRAVEHEGLRAVGVLSGNRNFQGRVNPHLAGAYLCSPALVIAYALAGTVLRDLTREPLGLGSDGRPVFLRDIAPASEEVSSVLERWVRPALFAGRYDAVWEGSAEWRAVPAPGGVRFPWDPKSDYVRPPPYFEGATITPPASLAIRNARVLLKLGDNVTTDHISPAGAIPRDSLAGKYLRERGVVPRDFNQYSTRRTNHEVMLRGAFSNPGLINELGPVDVYSRKDGGPFVIVAGNNYGAGSSRDWAAKAPALLGVKAIAAASFERLHRSNLIGMGIVPLTLPAGVDRHRLARDGTETIDFEGLDSLQVGNNTVCAMVRRDAELLAVDLDCRIDSGQELAYLRNGGLLPYVWRRIVTPLDA